MNRAQRRAQTKTKKSSSKLGLSLVAATALTAGQLSAFALPANASGSCSAVTNEDELQDCVDGVDQVITITQSFTLESGEIEIDRDVTIQGSNPAIFIDGGATFFENGDIDEYGTRIFYSYDIGGPINLKLQNLTLKNGSGEQYERYAVEPMFGGGLVYSGNTNLELSNMTLQDSFAYYGGGGVRLNGGSLTVTNSTFTNNRSGQAGGSIFSSGDVTIVNSTFDENYSGWDGGAIFFRNDGSLTIENSTFTDNSGSGGGAIYAALQGDDDFSPSSISNSTFDGNYARSTAGALRVNLRARNKPFTISNTIFNENTASNNMGGAVLIDNSVGDSPTESPNDNNPVTIANSTFTKNESEGSRGGALELRMGEWSNSVTTITNTIFRENTADYTGGAIYVDDGYEVIFNNLTFDSNSSGGGGGAVYLEDVNHFAISNTVFMDNFNGDNGGPYANHRGRGGALYVGAVELFTIANSTFSGNIALREGGAVFTRARSRYESIDSEVIFSTFTNNTAIASDTGQAIHAYSDSSTNELRLFGNIFALPTGATTLPQLFADNDTSNIIDLGYNFSTNASDQPLLGSESSKIVSFDDLSLSAAPEVDLNYPGSSAVIALSPTSVAANVIDQTAFSAAGAQLIGFSESELNPENFTDQRGFVRTFNFDAGSYEAQARVLEIIPVVKKVVLPAAPARIELKRAGKLAIKVSWSAPLSAGTGRILSYEIYRNGKKIATVPASTRSYRDTRLETNVSYTYQVVTVGTQGKSIKSRTSFSKFLKR